MATRMQQRRGTAAQWISTNGGDGPILNAGEIGFESDTGKFKIGDGVNHWIDLEYFINAAAIETDIEGAISDTEKGAANGVATLDSNAKLTSSQLPDIAQVTVHAVANQAARLALSVQPGDIAIQSDNGQTYVLSASPASTNGNWTAITVSDPFPTHDTDDLTEGATNKYFTDERAQDAIGSLVGNGLSYNDSTGAISVDTTTIQARVADVSDTEIGYLNGVTSSIQNQFEDKAPKASPTFTGTLNAAAISTSGNVTVGGDLTVNGTTTTVNSTEVNIQNAFVFEGTTANGYETTLTVVDPTSDRTLTLPDETGTIATQSYVQTNFASIQNAEIQGSLTINGTGIIIEGTTSNDYETTLLVTDPTADRTITFPDASGTVVLTDTSNTLSNKTISYTNNTITVQTSNINDITASASELNTLDGITASTAELNTLDGITASTAELNILGGATISTSELNHLDGVTSSIQTQIDGKADTVHSHVIADITDITASSSELNTLDGITASTAELNILDGVTADATELNVLDGITASTAELNLLDGVTATTAELNYVDGVTSAIQSQLDNKSATGHTHTLIDVTDITASAVELNTLDGITASTAELNILDGVTADASELNILDGATLSTTELNYVDGVTSAIQTQLDDKLALSGGTLTGNLILNANPTNDYGAATKAYVDSATAGLNVHEAVRVATTANINLGSPLMGGSDIENGKVLDGVTLVTGDRVLVKNQTYKSSNGVYLVHASGAAPRATDYDQVGEVDAGDFIFVQSGTVNGKTGWVQTNTISTIGTDDIEFTQFSGAGTYSAGTGLTLSGTEFSINTATTVDTSTAQTLTNKTITLGSNTVSGTISEFNSSLTDADFATLSGTETLSNKTLSSPTVSGTLTLAADPTSALQAATKQYVDNVSYATASSGSASYSVTTANSNKLTEISHSSEVTVTVPSDASDTSYPIGTTMDFRQMGAGRLSFVWTSPATKVSTDGYTKSRTQYSVVTLEKRASNAWIIYGDIDA
jgi:hypothetical protein